MNFKINREAFTKTTYCLEKDKNREYLQYINVNCNKETEKLIIESTDGIVAYRYINSISKEKIEDFNYDKNIILRGDWKNILKKSKYKHLSCIYFRKIEENKIIVDDEFIIEFKQDSYYPNINSFFSVEKKGEVKEFRIFKAQYVAIREKIVDIYSNIKFYTDYKGYNEDNNKNPVIFEKEIDGDLEKEYFVMMPLIWKAKDIN